MAQFFKGQTPWNKGTKGSQIAWNKGRGKKAIANCLNCNVSFKYKPNKYHPVRLYCSRECYQNDKNVHTRLSSISSLGVEKIKRGEVIYPPRGGENHWNWKGGISDIKHLMRRSLAWRGWRRLIFERDNYTCRDCGKSGGYLEPHHIIPLRETLSRAYEINNGITLCRPCHMKTMGKEKSFEAKYLQMVNTCN